MSSVFGIKNRKINSFKRFQIRFSSVNARQRILFSYFFSVFLFSIAKYPFKKRSARDWKFCLSAVHLSGIQHFRLYSRLKFFPFSYILFSLSKIKIVQNVRFFEFNDRNYWPENKVLLKCECFFFLILFFCVGCTIGKSICVSVLMYFHSDTIRNYIKPSAATLHLPSIHVDRLFSFFLFQ